MNRLAPALLLVLSACASTTPPEVTERTESGVQHGGRGQLVTLDEGEPLFVGLPADLPSDYVPSLRAALKDEPNVRSAHLFQVYSADDDVINVVLAVSFDGPDAELFALGDRLGALAGPPLERMGRVFGLVRRETTGALVPGNAIEVYVRG
ncbi:MAG TPA: hypothetical protein VGB53_10645 [Rubricoccaceae bacterium]|jgi:hypothetical protein